MKAGFGLERFRIVGTTVIVTMLLAGVVGKAATTLTTANSAVTNYNLAAGATSSAITPPTNTGVLLLGSNSTSTNFSVGSVNLVHVSGKEIRWTGLESPPSGSIVHGASTTPGTHVVFLDYAHQVDVEILSADALVVHNKSTTAQAGSMKFIW